MKTKKKEEPVPQRRKHVFVHRDYLMDISEQIERMRPDRMTIFNTLLGVYQTGYGTGYETNTGDRRYFKDKQSERRKSSLDSVLTQIEDIIHKPKQ